MPLGSLPPHGGRCATLGDMLMDVVVETRINRPVHAVSAFAGDPSNAPEWYANIKRIEWQTEPPMRVGSRVAFVAMFLGRQLEYVYEIVEHVPGERLVMHSDGKPFPMRTTYAWEQAGEGQSTEGRLEAGPVWPGRLLIGRPARPGRWRSVVGCQLAIGWRLGGVGLHRCLLGWM